MHGRCAGLVLNLILPADAVRCLQCRLGGAKTGVEEDVGPGDVMVIPAGVAHERYSAPCTDIK